MLFKQRFINTVDGTTADLLRNAVGKRVTIKRNSSWQDSPFEEVVLADPLNAIWFKEDKLLNTERQGAVNNVKYLLALGDAVQNAWDPTKFNLVFSSSGWDSRLLASLIYTAYRHRPGPVLFVCMEPEGSAFEKVMEYIGWSPSRYCVFDIVNKGWLWSLNFGSAWRQLNVPYKQPQSMFHCCFDYLADIGYLDGNEANLNIWTGLHSNESWGDSKTTLLDFVKERYTSKLSKLWGIIGDQDTIQPFADIDVLKVIFSAAPTHHSARLDILRVLDYGLSELPIGKPYRGQVIPPNVHSKMVADYLKSYYFRKFYSEVAVLPPDFNAVIHTQKCKRWSYHWTLASLVEYLVDKGVEVV